MTTIAYKWPHISTDSQGTRGDMVSNVKWEKHKEVDGYHFFFSGDPRYLDAMIECYFTGGKVEDSEFISCIVVTPEKDIELITFSEDGAVVPGEIKKEEHYAIGSGMEFAISAMDLGYSAKKAVKYACQRDIYSGGKVRTWKITEEGVVEV